MKTVIRFLFLFVVLAPFVDAEPFTGRVVGIADGDGIRVIHDGTTENVRIDGIDCPELVQRFGSQAYTRTTNLCFDKTVKVEPKGQDRAGWTVANVFLPDGSLLSETLVKEGMAWWRREYAPQNERLKSLEEAARTAKTGLWNDPSPVPPWVYLNGGIPEPPESVEQREARLKAAVDELEKKHALDVAVTFWGIFIGVLLAILLIRWLFSRKAAAGMAMLFACFASIVLCIYPPWLKLVKGKFLDYSGRHFLFDRAYDSGNFVDIKTLLVENFSVLVMGAFFLILALVPLKKRS